MEEDYLRLASDIRELVAQDQVEKAMEALQRTLRNREELNRVILQSARYHHLQVRLNMGTIPDELAGLELNRIRKALLDLAWELEREGKATTRVFLSYSRNGNGKELVQHLYQRLQRQQFGVFWDVADIPPGADWATTILRELAACDYFVLLLSEEANQSEMVLKEVEEARRLRDLQGRPLILPVRVHYPMDAPLNFKLQGWLQRIQQLSWESPRDTPEVVKRQARQCPGRVRPQWEPPGVVPGRVEQRGVCCPG